MATNEARAAAAEAALAVVNEHPSELVRKQYAGRGGHALRPALLTTSCGWPSHRHRRPRVAVAERAAATGGHRRVDRARPRPRRLGRRAPRGCSRCCSTTRCTAPPSVALDGADGDAGGAIEQAEPAAAELLQRLVVEEPAEDPAQEVFHLIRTATLREVGAAAGGGRCRRRIRDVRLLEQQLDDPEAGPERRPSC